MSILSVTECFDGRASTIGGNWERTYTRVFDVITSDPLVGSAAVRVNPDIPQPGEYYTNGLGIYDALFDWDYGAFVSEINAECLSDGGGIAWKVTVKYSSTNTAEFGNDPTLWKVRVQCGGERTERVVDFDRDGNPVRNSATDRFGDPVTVDDHITTLTITRNELVTAFDLGLASQFSDTINDATWNGFAAGHCKMGIITTSDPQYDSVSQRWYYTVTYPVQVGRNPWRKELLDQGYNELTGSYGSEVPTPIMNGGQPISDPVALDGSGHRLAVGGTPVTLPFEVFDETDWSGLNLDLSLRLGV